MEHLTGRPVSLVRVPDGITGQLFFQKHLEKYKMPGVIQLDQTLDPGHPPFLEVATPQGLLAASQMNVIEFHTWNATKNAIDKPDRMIFDLDPGEGESWRFIQDAGQIVRIFLNELGLVSFLKTSGGKGLHVVVPIKRLSEWDTVKGFSQAIVEHLAKVTTAFRSEERAEQQGGKNLHRLPAKRPESHHCFRLVRPRPSRAGRVRAACMGRAGGPHELGSLDRFQYNGASGNRECPLGRV